LGLIESAVKLRILEGSDASVRLSASAQAPAAAFQDGSKVSMFPLTVVPIR
jgi:hypothetical protein